ncbi:porphobilinogen synthase, partial [Mariniblastus sp.]|nr:porphobilinogen synthase [Mariniblastus sp.]
MPSFPQSRMRRVRQTTWSRAMVTENQLSPADLIWPVFVQPGENAVTPVASMPGVSRLSIDVLVKEVANAKQLGIPAIA